MNTVFTFYLFPGGAGPEQARGRGSTLEPLAHFDESTREVDYPSWSPDGTKIYFSMTLRVADIFLVERR